MQINDIGRIQDMVALLPHTLSNLMKRLLTWCEGWTKQEWEFLLWLCGKPAFSSLLPLGHLSSDICFNRTFTESCDFPWYHPIWYHECLFSEDIDYRCMLTAALNYGSALNFSQPSWPQFHHLFSVCKNKAHSERAANSHLSKYAIRRIEHGRGIYLELLAFAKVTVVILGTAKVQKITLWYSTSSFCNDRWRQWKAHWHLVHWILLGNMLVPASPGLLGTLIMKLLKQKHKAPKHAEKGSGEGCQAFRDRKAFIN